MTASGAAVRCRRWAVPIDTVGEMSEESISRTVAATPEQVWELIADLPRMGEWSNENTGGRWVKGATGAAPGARFRGSNRNGWHRWSTDVTVIDATPGERFSFDVHVAGIPVSRWTYELEPTGDGGCHVTESWTDRRPAWFRPLATLATGVGDRAEHTRAGMAHTLEQIAASAERAG